MTETISPTSVTELIEAVRSTPRLLAVGARTKPALSNVSAVKVQMTRLSGIIEYDPGEFTFTALAGTPLSQIIEALAQHGQYLPFDPMLVEAGATLGGTVASGLSGPGRFRYGGIRDFILGVRFVDGMGRFLKMGGKVVKNAAGFDLPKFFVGSFGRYGVLVELTFKVFPRPVANLTLKLPITEPSAALQVFIEAGNSRWQPDALDLLPQGKDLCIRLTGPQSALEEIANEILSRWPGQKISAAEAERQWSDLREFHWAHPDGVLLKVALSPNLVTRVLAEASSVEKCVVHVTAGGNCAFLSLASGEYAESLGSKLNNLGLNALLLRGAYRYSFGVAAEGEIVKAVKAALDPQSRF